MKNAKYNIATLPDLQFGLFNQIPKDYTFFLVGEKLAKEKIKTGLQDNWDPKDWRRIFEENNVISIGLINEQQYPKLKNELEIIQQKIDLEKSHFVALVQYQKPNLYHSQRSQSSEENFMISPEEFVRFYEKDISTGLCYHFILKAIGKEGSLEQIIAHQIGHPNLPILEDFRQTESVEVVMPHRGDSDDLEAALWYLEKQKVMPQKISVCFDEFVTEHHFAMADKNQGVRFFVN